jgi:hypothetical protein
VPEALDVRPDLGERLGCVPNGKALELVGERAEIVDEHGAAGLSDPGEGLDPGIVVKYGLGSPTRRPTSGSSSRPTSPRRAFRS